MRLSLAALAALAGVVNGFKDTSPYLLFSSSPLPSELRDASQSSLQSRTTVLQTTKEFLKSCPSEVYYILTQPSLSASDLASHAPHLKTAISDSRVKTRLAVSEVVGLEAKDGDELVRYIEKTCGGRITEELRAAQELNGKKAPPIIVQKAFEALSGNADERGDTLGDYDTTLYTHILVDLPKGFRYTVIYTTTPSTAAIEMAKNQDGSVYETDYNDPFWQHMELKRDLQSRRENKSDVMPDQRPLFEQYQFLSPGLFMGIVVTLILLTILSVGINGVSSLQVSYGAFDKEMGPAAQKKQ